MNEKGWEGEERKRERGERGANVACARYLSAKELASKLPTRVEIPTRQTQLHAWQTNSAGPLRSDRAQTAPVPLARHHMHKGRKETENIGR